MTTLDLDSAWFAGPGCVAFGAAERAIPCAMQIVGALDATGAPPRREGSMEDFRQGSMDQWINGSMVDEIKS